MTFTIETNQRSLINALVAICKAANVLNYKVDTTPKYNPKILAAAERYRAGDTEGSILFKDTDEMYRHFGMEPEQ